MGTSGNKVKYKSYVTVFVCACVLCFEEIFSSVQVINKISSTPQRREDIFAKTMTMGKMCKKLSSEKLFENILSLHVFCIIHIYSNKSSSWCYTKALQTVCRSLHFCVKDTKFLETENDYFIQYTNT